MANKAMCLRFTSPACEPAVTRPDRFDRHGESPYDEQVGILRMAPAGLRRPGFEPRFPRLLPLRSMVGQLPLEQHIGVRIPEGQPLVF